MVGYYLNICDEDENVKMSNRNGSHFLLLNDEWQDSSSKEDLEPSYNDLEAVQEEENSDSDDEDPRQRQGNKK